MKKMDVVFILDRSGSMYGSEKDTIGGFNNYIKKNKNMDYKVTTILFDDKYEMLYERLDINRVKKITEEDYYVRGCTALLDALGKSITYMDNKKSEKALFIITTDGLENASKEYTKEKIKKMIKTHKNYEFMYIGADIDSYQEGESIGIKRTNISNYKKTSKGINKMYDAISCASMSFMENEELDSSWKNDLEKD